MVFGTIPNTYTVGIGEGSQNTLFSVTNHPLRGSEEVDIGSKHPKTGDFGPPKDPKNPTFRWYLVTFYLFLTHKNT